MGIVLVAAALVGGVGGAAAFLLTRAEGAPEAPHVEGAAPLAAVEPTEMPAVPTAPSDAPDITAAAAEPERVMVAIESPYARAEAVIRGETVAIPFERTFTKADNAEIVAVRAPGREGRVFRIAFAGPLSLWVELDRDADEGIRDATAEELTAALAGRPADEPTAAPEPTRTRPVVRARRVEEPAPQPRVERRPAERSTTMRSNVYVGPSTTLPAF